MLSHYLIVLVTLVCSKAPKPPLPKYCGGTYRSHCRFMLVQARCRCPTTRWTISSSAGNAATLSSSCPTVGTPSPRASAWMTHRRAPPLIRRELGAHRRPWRPRERVLRPDDPNTRRHVSACAIFVELCNTSSQKKGLGEGGQVHARSVSASILFAPGMPVRVVRRSASGASVKCS
ncbi:hypothetical protein EDB86DRAFT_2983918 [Lactarius hatsudake]|nr:hypothetical protein EDB86DRAFT_2983918 [Lactarius hatsudake]